MDEMKIFEDFFQMHEAMGPVEQGIMDEECNEWTQNKVNDAVAADMGIHFSVPVKDEEIKNQKKNGKDSNR